MNAPVNDDTLIAYLDAELDPAGMDAVEQALQADVALRQRLRQLVAADEQLRAAYAGVMLEAVPPRLLQAILAAPPPASAPAVRPRAGSSLAPIGWLTRWWVSQTVPWIPTALASVAALGLGLWLGLVQAPGDSEAPLLALDQPVTDRALLVALETLPSGRLVTVAGRQIELLASFEHHDGRVCREFNSSSLEGAPVDHLGLACRDASPNWTLVALASENRPVDAAHGGYRTASDRQHETLDRYRQQHTQGQALEAAQELAWMQRGWHR